MKLANRLNLLLIPVALVFSLWSTVIDWLAFQDSTSQFAEEAMAIDVQELDLLGNNSLFIYYFDDIAKTFDQDALRDLNDINQLFHHSINDAMLAKRTPLRFSFYDNKGTLLTEKITTNVTNRDIESSPQLDLSKIEIDSEGAVQTISVLNKDIHITTIPIGNDPDRNNSLSSDEVQGYIVSQFRLPVSAFRDNAWEHFLKKFRSSLMQMVLMILILIWIGRSMHRPFNHFIEQVNNVSNHSFKIPFNTDSSINEIRVLANSLESMREEILKQQAELIQTRDEALAAVEAKSRFLATMSHEIRTPMNGVLGMADLLSDTPMSEKQQQYVDVIHSSGNTLLTIINDILDFSKIEVGKIILEEVPFRLRDLVQELEMMFKLQIQKRNIVILVDFDPTIPNFIIGDSHRLRQVLFNLIGNAVKFTNQGTISINIQMLSIEPSSTSINFTISDTGIGISPSRMKQLFQPFVQGDNSTSRKFGGTGLGLSISDRLTKLMGGKIEVDSLPNIGSKFSVTLKFGVADIQSISSDSIDGRDDENNLSIAKRASISILIAEDDEINRLYIQELLTSLGYINFQIATNGHHALEIIMQHRFNLILMDCQMPGMDGYETTRRIRAKEQAENNKNHLPIVALTANALAEDRQLCIDAGMDDYLSKPLQGQDLDSTLSKWLGNPSARKE